MKRWKVCVCDSTFWPYGCLWRLNETNFRTDPTGGFLRVIGPYEDHALICPAGRECTITLDGVGLANGDKVREFRRESNNLIFCEF